MADVLDQARAWLADDPDPRMREQLAVSLAAAEGGDGEALAELADAFAGPLLVIPRLGTALVDGQPVRPGECALATSLAQVSVAEIGQVLLAGVPRA